MKKVLTLLGLATLLLLILPAAQAQKFKVLEGDVKALSSISGLKMEYVYTPMNVGKLDEAAYVSKKVEEQNKKEAGKGDRWKASWIADRKKRFEPTFEELFNKYSRNVQLNSSAAYTLIMHTTFTEPGYNVVVQRRNASIDAIFTILDSNGNVVAKIEMTGAPGRSYTGYQGGYDYDTGVRIEESYAMAGKGLAKKYFGK